MIPILGRREVTRTLRVGTYREACARASLVDAQVERMFRVLGVLMKTRAEDLTRRLCDQFYQEFMHEDSELRRRGLPDPDRLNSHILAAYLEPLEAEASRLLAADRSTVAEEAKRLLEEAGECLEGDDLDRQHAGLQETLLLALRDSAELWEARAAGRRIPGAAYPGTESILDSPRLSDAVGRYLKEEGPGWAAKTLAETECALQRFVQVVGDMRLASISREHVDTYRTTLSRIPKGLASDAQITAYIGADMPEKPLSSSTVKKLFGRVGAFFGWARNRGWIERSPAEGMARRTRAQDAPKPRGQFNDAQLASVFGIGFVADSLGKGRPARFWLPLLALYTGARRGEIAQLRRDDVAVVDGEWCVAITGEGDGQRLKNSASKRIVPIHSHVIELGFVRWVEGHGNERGSVFPDVTLTKNGWGASQGAWFRRRIRALGVIDRNRMLDFHSFRHTVATRLGRANVPVDRQKAILGHADDDITTGLYGGGDLPIGLIRDAIETLDFRAQLTVLEDELQLVRKSHPEAAF